MYVNWSHRAAVSDTVEWLEYGPPGAALGPGRRTFIPYRDICFISDKPEVGAHLYLDDGPHNVLALREAGDQVLVYDQRYNRHLGGPRVHDWSEVGREVHAALARYQASA